MGEKSLEVFQHRPCKKCAAISFRVEHVTHKNNTEHLKRICLQCNSFIDFAAQEYPPGMFILSFGKYKGFPIYQIVENDLSYAKRLRDIKPNSSIGRRLSIVIKEFET